jgi:hypothetical protein
LSEQIDPQRAVDFIRDNAATLAKAKAERVYMEEFRKTLKAKLMKKCVDLPVTAQEREAYAHPDYEAHLLGLKEAVEVEERLRWQMVAAQARVEVWRSQEASNRAMDRASA